MKKVILITGTSSGIGWTCAEHLAACGHRVFGLSRHPKAEETRQFTAIPCDITDAQALEQAVGGIVAENGRIDVLINCAGMGIAGPVEETEMEAARQQMEINFFGTFNCIRTLLPVMRRQSSGLIITVSSVGGLMGLPFQGFYSASKFALEGLTESLRMELKGSGIHATLVNPGDFRTEFTARRQKIARSQEPASPYYEQFKESMAQIEKDENGGLETIVAAKLMARLVDKKSPTVRYVTASFEQRLAVWLKRILPARWYEAMLAGHYRL